MNEQVSPIAELLRLMECLRHPEHGCPWDRAQNFASIAPHTLEEVYEVIDAIESGDLAQLRDELGDLLFQIVFYAQLAKEQQRFDFDAVVNAITQKLLRRHPHVFPLATLASFGQGSELTDESIVSNWEATKADERRDKQGGKSVSVLDDVPLALPALQRAAKLQKRAATQGFDWSHAQDVMVKLEEELAELKEGLVSQQQLHIDEEFGDLLFTMVNLSRHLALNADQSLRAANAKFERRYRQVEMLVEKDGKTVAEMTQEELEKYWIQVKVAEQKLA
jgi:nucleoside triphosphate diphosphatase